MCSGNNSKSDLIAKTFLVVLLALCFSITTLGGYVRLSESGMAIPEWPVFTKRILVDDAGNETGRVKGVLPPRSEEEWVTLKETFVQDVPGFESGIAMSEFKKIFYVEWSHRAVGGVIKLVYLSFLVFVLANVSLRKRIGALAITSAVVLATQIVLGGILVKVHLRAEALATHLTGAFVFTSLLCWCLLRLVHPPVDKSELKGSNPILVWAVAIYGIILFQIFSGGLMAGNKAGYMMNTWPMMGDSWVPPALIDSEMSILGNFMENKIFVQFFHRWFAIFTAVAVLFLVFRSLTVKVSTAGRWFLRLIFGVIILQVIVGIYTLKLGVHPHLALTHQSLGLVVLLNALCIIYETKNHPVLGEEALAAAAETAARSNERGAAHA